MLEKKDFFLHMNEETLLSSGALASIIIGVVLLILELMSLLHFPRLRVRNELFLEGKLGDESDDVSINGEGIGGGEIEGADIKLLSSGTWSGDSVG